MSQDYDAKELACKFCREDIMAEQTFLSNGKAYGLVCLAPLVPFHTLIVPKAHGQHELDLSLEDMLAVADMTYKVKSILEFLAKTKSFTELVQDGPYSHQTIPHYHKHLYPRTKKDYKREQWYGMVLQSRMDWKNGQGVISKEEMEKTRQVYTDAARHLGFL